MEIRVRPITKDAFAHFGELLEFEAPNVETREINAGTALRYHGLSRVDVEGGAPIINVFRAEPYTFPFDLRSMERHPFGSQTFYPLQEEPWLVVVAHDDGGQPGPPQVFLLNGRQGVTYAKNTWHHPLLVLNRVCDFLVVDREKPENNLEEARYDDAFYINALDAKL